MQAHRKSPWYLHMFALFLLMSIVNADEWLEGGYVGSYQGDIGQYFTDPIFFTRVPISQPMSFYEPYNAARFSREPLRLGKLPDRSLPLLFQSRSYLNVYPSSPKQSDFRNKSLAAMQWGTFQKELDSNNELCKGYFVF